MKVADSMKKKKSENDNRIKVHEAFTHVHVNTAF